MRKPNNGTITTDEIVKAYQRAFSVPWWRTLAPSCIHVCFHLADQTYQPADFDKIAEVVALDQSDKEEYVAEDFDCDDFAFSLMGAFHRDRETAAMPIFITWVLTPGGGHAVVSFYNGVDVTIIEPQNDTIFAVPKTWSLMLIIG